MARAKATVRRLPVTMPARIGNKNMLNRRLRVMSFKIKRIMPEKKRVPVKKTDKQLEK